MTEQTDATDGQPFPGTGQRWEYGQALPSWPMMKIARAASLKSELDSRMRIWAASNPFSLEQGPSDDRMFWRGYLKVNALPPAQEWSLLLGDCLHNLRSALDAAVWAFAHVDGNVPPKPRGLQFPILTDKSKWEKARRENLQTVPAVVAERIRLVQPFNRAAGDVDNDGLARLAELNNQDKHRSMIKMGLDPHQIHFNLVTGFGSEEGAGVRNGHPKLKATFPDGLVDGAQVLEISFTDPLQDYEGGVVLEARAVIDTAAGPADFGSQVGGLIEFVGGVLQFIAVGPATPEELKRASEAAAAQDWTTLNLRHDGRSVSAVSEGG